MNEVNPAILLAAIELNKSGYRPHIRHEAVSIDAEGNRGPRQVSDVLMAHYPATYRVVYDELVRAFNNIG